MTINFPANPVADELYTDPSNNYTYQWKVDPESLTGQGKWTTRISRTTGALDEEYLRLDATNGPMTGYLGVPGLGVGTEPINDVAIAISGGFIQQCLYPTAVDGVYTLDIFTGNRFITSGSINGPTTINLSNLENLPVGYEWEGKLSFSYTSGDISWFTDNDTYTVKWDGGTQIEPTGGEVETVIITAIGGSSTIEIMAMKGRS